jgi:hypothetical protein
MPYAPIAVAKPICGLIYSHKPSVVRILAVSFPVNTHPSVYACFLLTTQNRYKSIGFAI